MGKRVVIRGPNPATDIVAEGYSDETGTFCATLGEGTYTYTATDPDGAGSETSGIVTSPGGGFIIFPAASGYVCNCSGGVLPTITLNRPIPTTLYASGDLGDFTLTHGNGGWGATVTKPMLAGLNDTGVAQGSCGEPVVRDVTVRVVLDCYFNLKIRHYVCGVDLSDPCDHYLEPPLGFDRGTWNGEYATLRAFECAPPPYSLGNCEPGQLWEFAALFQSGGTDPFAKTYTVFRSTVYPSVYAGLRCPVIGGCGPDFGYRQWRRLCPHPDILSIQISE